MDIFNILLSLTIVLQLTAAVLAARLLLLRKRRIFGLVTLTIILLMAFIRLISFYDFITEGAPQIVLLFETIAFSISLLILASIVYLSRLIEYKRKMSSMLEDSKHRYQTLFNQSPDGVLLIDLNGHVIEFNDAAAGDLGYTRDEFSKLHLSDLDPVESTEEIQKSIEDILNKGKAEFEVKHRTKGGEVRDVHVITQVVEFAGERVFHTIWRDITEEKLAVKTLSEHQSLLQTIIDTEPECIKLLDSNGTVLLMNRAGLAMIEVDSFDQVKGQCIYPLVAPEYRETFRSLTEEVFKGKSGLLEFQVVGIKGRHLWLETHAVPLRNDNNEITALLGVTRDITARKKAEDELKRSEERYHGLYDAITDAVFVHEMADDGRPGRFIEINDVACRRLGYSREELLGMSPLNIDAVDFGRDIANRPLIEKLLSGETISFEQIHVAKKGRRIPVEINARMFMLHGINVVISLVRDITERKKTEEAIVLMNESLNSLLEASPAAIMTLTPDGIVTLWNRAAEQIFGWTREEIIGKLNPMVPEDKLSEFRALRERVIAGGSFSGMEIKRKKKDGSPIDISLSTAPIRNKSGEVAGIMAIMLDITEKIQVAQALIASEKKFRDFLDTIQLVAVMLDQHGNITFCNEYLLSLTGWNKSDVLGKNWFDLFIPEEVKKTVRTEFKSNIDNAAALHTENPILTRDGAQKHIVWDVAVLNDSEGSVIGTASIGVDVTEHRKLEEQLRHALKMEAIGQLAGGVAHDFNNILSAITGYASLSLIKMPDDDPLRDNIEQILQASDRATALTHSLLAFSRKQPVTLKPIDLNELVRSFYKFMLRLLTENIELKLSCSEEKLQTIVDRGQIEQVLMNLVTNARDAMPDGGRITIETGFAALDDESAQISGLEKAGDYGLIMVTDTGTGMDTEISGKIFDPFFTTKELGRGTGLGLSVVYGIIKKHNGNINIYSEPGKGTSFRIFLPIQNTATEETEEQEKDQPVSGGSETILIAEDDESLRRLTKSVLANYGYTIIEAFDGEDAIEKFIMHKDSIQLVILDGIMPIINGKEAYDEISAISPDIKVIFMSGYSEDVFKSKDVTEKGVICLLKPVKPIELIKKVREVLNK